MFNETTISTMESWLLSIQTLPEGIEREYIRKNLENMINSKRSYVTPAFQERFDAVVSALETA